MNYSRLEADDMIELVKKDKTIINKPDKNGDTLLNCASIDNIELIAFLLENGADPNLPNEEDGATIINKCSDFYMKELKLLLKYGADPNLNTTSYKSRDYDEQTLSAQSKTDYPNGINTKCSNYETIKLLLEHGMRPNNFNDDNYTILNCDNFHCYSYKTVELILEHGGDPHIRNPKNESAFTMCYDLDMFNLFMKSYKKEEDEEYNGYKSYYDYLMNFKDDVNIEKLKIMDNYVCSSSKSANKR